MMDGSPDRPVIETPLGTTLWDLANAIHEPVDCDAEGFAVAEVMLTEGRVSVPFGDEGVCGPGLTPEFSDSGSALWTIREHTPGFRVRRILPNSNRPVRRRRDVRDAPFTGERSHE